MSYSNPKLLLDKVKHLTINRSLRAITTLLMMTWLPTTDKKAKRSLVARKVLKLTSSSSMNYLRMSKITKIIKMDLAKLKTTIWTSSWHPRISITN